MFIEMRLGWNFGIVLLLMCIMIYNGVNGIPAQNEKMNKIVSQARAISPFLFKN